uniref:Uncharacterized protein n=1 Tax=Opuntia streptacantha TaxID=393608 RepID=A0A7C9ELF3_OPUST
MIKYEVIIYWRFDPKRLIHSQKLNQLTHSIFGNPSCVGICFHWVRQAKLIDIDVINYRICPEGSVSTSLSCTTCIRFFKCWSLSTHVIGKNSAHPFKLLSQC